MKPVDTSYVIIPYELTDSWEGPPTTSIGAYVFNDTVELSEWQGVRFTLSDGREGVGTPYFGLGLVGLVSKLMGGSPKPRIQVATKQPYALGSELVDYETIDQIKDLLTLKCAKRDCKEPTRYAVRFVLGQGHGPGFTFSRGRTTTVCYDHINEFIDDSMKVYSSEWSVVRREFPIDGSREKNLGRIRV